MDSSERSVSLGVPRPAGCGVRRLYLDDDLVIDLCCNGAPHHRAMVSAKVSCSFSPSPHQRSPPVTLQPLYTITG